MPLSCIQVAMNMMRCCPRDVIRALGPMNQQKKQLQGIVHTHFDPAVIQAFIQLHERFKLFSEQHADEVLDDSSMQA